MAGPYDHNPDGLDGVVKILRSLQAQIDSIRSGAGVKSSILRGDTFQFQSVDAEPIVTLGANNLPGQDGEGLYVLDVDPAKYILVADRHEDSGIRHVLMGTSSNYIDLVQIRSEDISVHANDNLFLASDTDDVVVEAPSTAFIGNGVGNVSLAAGGSNPDIFMFGIGTTASAANLRVQTSDRSVKEVTSARKFKADIEDAVVDPADVLKLRPRTWFDKGEKAAYDDALVNGVKEHFATKAEADAAKADKKRKKPKPRKPARGIGFVADEVAEHPTLRQFVEFNDKGEPHAISYDRLAVALLAVAKAQQTELGALTKRVDSIEKRLAAPGGTK